jgi:hypothetical protein
MNWAVTVYAAILFFVLTPAILLRLPPNGSKMTVAAVHAVVFALVFHFTHKIVWQMSMGMGMPMHVRKEGMEDEKKKKGAEEEAMNAMKMAGGY